jgi:hypothetical protein
MPGRAARPTFEQSVRRPIPVPIEDSESEIEEERLEVIETAEGPGVVIEEAFGVLDFDPGEVTGILTKRAEEEERARERRAAETEKANKRVKYG